MAMASTDMIVGGRYLAECRLKSGSFGAIYKGRDLTTNQLVAIKVEASDAKHAQLRFEAKLYRTFAGAHGVPSAHWFGNEGPCNALVLDLLGPSLQDLRDSCDGRFSLKTVLMLADQMMNRLEWLHSRGFLHRDVKPDNFVMGVGDKAKVVQLIDFGLAKKFKTKDLEHIPYRENKRFIGSLRYASVQAHLGIEQGRRDDLESLGYVLMYLLRGSLPWQNVEGDNEHYLKCKMATPTERLCEGFPNEFAVYVNNCKNLRFQDRPNYCYLKEVLRDAFSREGYRLDFVYDWDAVDLFKHHHAATLDSCGGGSWSSHHSFKEEVSTRTPSSLATDNGSSLFAYAPTLASSK